MITKNQKFWTKIGMLAVVAFLVLPVSAFAQGKSQGRGKPTDVFVNGHDARDGRWDKDNQQKQREAELQRQRARRHNDDYNRNRRGRSWDQYGGYGGSSQLRQTALNAGYNNGIKEGRKDRSHGDRFDYRDEGSFQKATADYSSRLGDRELYRRYFREGFANGYGDGYRGY
jgi:hypothetical protein